MHFDQYFILWNYCNNNRKGKRKIALCPLGQNSHSTTGPEGKRPTRAGTRARQVFKPNGRGQLRVREIGGKREVRMIGGARVTSSTSRPEGSASSPTAPHGTAGRAGGTVGLKGMSPFGWWWRWSLEQPCSPVTRSCSEGASGGGHSRQQKKGKTAGNVSVGCGGSRSRKRSRGGGLYLANAGEPKRRSSSSISSSGPSGDELGCCGMIGVCRRKWWGEESPGRAYIAGRRLTMDP